MKTIDSIIEDNKFEYERGDSSGNIDLVREIDEEKLAVDIQEYAEEYAKALIEWTYENDIIEGEQPEEIIKRFKESLKK